MVFADEDFAGNKRNALVEIHLHSIICGRSTFTILLWNEFWFVIDLVYNYGIFSSESNVPSRLALPISTEILSLVN